MSLKNSLHSSIEIYEACFNSGVGLGSFLGSGTTTKIAASLGRNSIGYEIGFNRENWKQIIKKKIESGENKHTAIFSYH